MKNLALPVSVVAAGLIIAGAVILTKSPRGAELPKTGDRGEEIKTEVVVSEKDHIRGNLQAPVTIVEFSDFQCPFCLAFHPTVQQILADFGESARWVYKHFPLDKIHPQARPGAEASECVFEQKGDDGFWQFADSLFESQERLGKEFYKELAENLELNMEQFNNCVSSRKYKDKVEANLQEGRKAGVDRTPWSFVNGEPILGAVPYETLKEAILKALGESKTPELQFAQLSNAETNFCAGPDILERVDAERLQGSCCSAMDFHRYTEQIEGLKKYSHIDKIPADPYDIPVSLAEELLDFQKTIQLTSEQQSVYDAAVKLSHEGGPCCCKCWRWYAFEGLAKYLITEYGFKAGQIAEVWDLEDGCGGPGHIGETQHT